MPLCHLNVWRGQHRIILRLNLVNDLTSVGEKLETHKAFLVGHMINQGRKVIAEDMHVWPKKMLRRCYVQADVIIFVYEVPCIFWRYINVDEVSWVTLKKLLQSAIELLQIPTA